MDKIISVLNANAENAPDEMVADFQNLPVNPQTGEYDFDAQNAFLKKWSPYIQENFQNWEEIDYKQGQPLSERLSADNVSYDNPNANIIEGLARKYNSTSEEVSKALTEIKKNKEYNEGRKRRAQEIKEAGLLSPWTLASEYSKQRYIDDPDNSIFGKEGNFNPYGSEGQRELRDVILGGTGAVADLIPGLGGVVVGPAVRAGRDVSHKVDDSPYQKDWSEIASSAGTDLLINAGTNYLPTMVLRQPARYAKGAKGTAGKISDYVEDVEKAMDVGKRKADITEGLAKTEGVKPGPKTKELLESLPDGEMKNSLIGAYGKGTPEDFANFQKELAFWKKATEGTPEGDWLMWPNKYTSKKYRELPNPQAKWKEQQYSSRNPSTAVKAGTVVAKTFKNVGEPAVKEITTAKGGREVIKPKETLDAKIQRWSKFGPTPEESKSEEYKQWHEENLYKMMGVQMPKK